MSLHHKMKESYSSFGYSLCVGNTVVGQECSLRWEKARISVGVNKRFPSMVLAELATCGRPRWDLSVKGGLSIFQKSGITLGRRWGQTRLCELFSRT